MLASVLVSSRIQYVYMCEKWKALLVSKVTELVHNTIDRPLNFHPTLCSGYLQHEQVTHMFVCIYMYEVEEPSQVTVTILSLRLLQ